MPRARLSDLDRVRELPYWPAASLLRQQAGQMAASGRSAITPIYRLAFRGASTESKCTAIFLFGYRSQTRPEILFLFCFERCFVHKTRGS